MPAHYPYFGLISEMWYEFSHALALMVGVMAGLLSSPEFVLCWAGVYNANKNGSKWKRHFFGIMLGLVVHKITMQILGYYFHV